MVGTSKPSKPAMKVENVQEQTTTQQQMPTKQTTA